MGKLSLGMKVFLVAMFFSTVSSAMIATTEASQHFALNLPLIAEAVAFDVPFSWGTIISVIAGIFGGVMTWLLKRTIDNFDATQKSMAASLASMQHSYNGKLQEQALKIAKHDERHERSAEQHREHHARLEKHDEQLQMHDRALAILQK